MTGPLCWISSRMCRPSMFTRWQVSAGLPESSRRRETLGPMEDSDSLVGRSLPSPRPGPLPTIATFHFSRQGWVCYTSKVLDSRQGFVYIVGHFASPSSSPVQDTGLSRRQHRFKSGWGRQKIKGLRDRSQPTGPPSTWLPSLQTRQSSQLVNHDGAKERDLTPVLRQRLGTLYCGFC